MCYVFVKVCFFFCLCVCVCVGVCVCGWVCLIAVKTDRVRFWHIKKRKKIPAVIA